MLQFLLVVHFLLTVSIIGLIMLQKHDSDGALGSSGGAEASMFSVRGQANILTKLTEILMTVFIVNCLVMAKIAKHPQEKGSIIDRAASYQKTDVDNKTSTQNTNVDNQTSSANKVISSPKNSNDYKRGKGDAGKNTASKEQPKEKKK
jgi:preprotein translocase subunit SecG